MATNAARKQPSQQRSRVTVDAILEATSRILVDDGYASLTTTRVAELAGVGVGTLYQYFPRKEALVVALLEANLARMEAAVMAAASRVDEDATLAERLDAVIDAFVTAKAQRPELSQALRRQLPQVEGDPLVRAMMRRMRALVRRLLEAHADELVGVDLDLAATMLTTSIEGAVSAVLDLSPSLLRKRELRDALHALARGYLRESGWRSRARRAGARVG
jgi:AcrR family transcriptional regulator